MAVLISISNRNKESRHDRRIIQETKLSSLYWRRQIQTLCEVAEILIRTPIQNLAVGRNHALSVGRKVADPRVVCKRIIGFEGACCRVPEQAIAVLAAIKHQYRAVF